MEKTPQYQRAVTPTIDNAINGSGFVKGKIISYTSNSNNRPKYPKVTLSTEKVIGNVLSTSSKGAVISPRPTIGLQINQSEMNIQGRANARAAVAASSVKSSDATTEQLSALSVLPRYDLVPLSDELPADGVIFSRIRHQPESLVVFRTQEERQRNPERLNLDRRQLEVCPLLEQEQRLRLLNYQNNNIRIIQNLENLPNLIFLDLYNNKITTLEGPLSTVKGLRVLMAGKNKIGIISNLNTLRKLDVLDLHSNEIRVIEGLDGLSDLRVLNLAGNRISSVDNLASLVCLTELNLRRNNIECVTGLDKLPALQRVFLSHNQIKSRSSMTCLFEVAYLIELSLDGNPLSDADPATYRLHMIQGIPGLRHLDLKRITDEERIQASGCFESSTSTDRLLRISSGGNPSNVVVDVSGDNNRTRNNDADADGGLWTKMHRDSTQSSCVPFDTIDRSNTAIDNAKSYSQSTNGSTNQNSSEHTVPSPMKLIEPTERQHDTVKNIRTHLPESIGGLAADTHPNSSEQETKHHPRAFSDNLEATTFTVSKSQNSQQQQHPLGGLTALARSGRLSSANSIFDIEIIGPDEKALIAVGDSWEWPQSRQRLLLNVTEASFYHMRRDTILSRFGNYHASCLPSLRSLRLVGNDFSTLTHVEFISEIFGHNIEHLVVKDCPIHTAAPALLRSFLIASLTGLKSFNDVEVNTEERSSTESMYCPFKASSSPHRFLGPQSPSLSSSNPSTIASSILKVRKSATVRTGNTTSSSSGSSEQQESDSGVATQQQQTRNVLQRRQLAVEFDAAFEKAMLQIIFETLELAAQQRR